MAVWDDILILKYTNGAFDDYYMNNKCNTCDDSDGICGYSPPNYSFVCASNNGFNISTDCYNNYNPIPDNEDLIGSSTSLPTLVLQGRFGWSDAA
ncbi:hypothetical protein CRYUN_Cryun17cG0095000 [Craigia yunnanensis]